MTGTNPEHDKDLTELFSESGSRTEVPPEHLASIKTAFRAEWRRRVAKDGSSEAPTTIDKAAPEPSGAVRIRQESEEKDGPPRRWLPLAAVLLIGLGLGGWWLLNGPSSAPTILAQIEHAGSSLRWNGGDGPMALGQEVPTGATLSSGPDEGSALRLANGASLRLDANSRVILTSAERVDLEAGAVYLQSEGGPPVAIHTAYGVAREIGTQFEVRVLEPATLRLRVREGLVFLEYGDGKSETASPGEEITLGAKGEIKRAQTDPWASHWRWALDAAPELEIDGRPLLSVLADIAREAGLDLRFESSEIEAQAGEAILHGRLGSVAPDRALDAILPGTGLTHRIEEGNLWIGNS